MIRMHVFATTVAFFLLAGTGDAGIWHIQPDGSGDAPTIQAGIDSAVVGDTVELACGTYFEHDIVLKSGIVLQGETGSPSCAVIDAQELGRVLLCDSVDSATRVEELILTGGRLTGEGNENGGGGLLCRFSSLSIVSCLVTENSCEYGGGGIWICEGSTPVVVGCFISNNRAESGGGMGSSQSTPTIDACTLYANETVYDGGGMWVGGAIPIVRHCVFLENLANSDGGGFSCVGADVKLDSCCFSGNRAIQGGGAESHSGASPTYTGCLFSNNHASVIGGGINCKVNAPMTLRECTLVYNSAPSGGGIGRALHTAPKIENTVIAFSTEGEAVSGWSNIECSDFFGNAGGDWTGQISGFLGQDGNISADPLFCDAESGDFTLEAASPCLPGNHPAGYACGFIGAFGEGCDTYTSIANAGSAPAGVLGLFVSPNPSMGEVSLRYSRSANSVFPIAIYDIRGRLVQSFSTEGPAGVLVWDGCGASGERVAPGIYFVRIADGRRTTTTRLTIVR